MTPFECIGMLKEGRRPDFYMPFDLFSHLTQIYHMAYANSV